MEKTIRSVAFADYAKKHNLNGQGHPVVKKSENGLYVTLATDNIIAEGEYAGRKESKNIWFARTVVEQGLVSEGQALSDLGLGDMIVCTVQSENGEREKLAFPGESKYTKVF